MINEETENILQNTFGARRVKTGNGENKGPTEAQETPYWKESTDISWIPSMIWKAMMEHLSKNLECQLLQICTGAAHMVAGKEDLNLVGTKILWLFTNLHLEFPLPAESVSS